MTTAVLKLNQGQLDAADGFFKFLFETHNELIISGPGGVGKTFLMGHFIDTILPRYHEACKLMGLPAIFQEVVMTATTNKATEVLSVQTGRPAETIHSFLNLKVTDDYATGTSKLTKTNAWMIHHNKIIFIDEASMIDRALLEMIRSGTCNCKIIFVGDHCQLAPVKEPISPIYNQRLPFFELIEPMRNNGQPALMNLCNQLRQTVETTVFHPIQLVKGVVDHLEDADLQDLVDREFATNNTNSRILAYTNSSVNNFNGYIRHIRKYTDTYIVGETLINNASIILGSGRLSVEEEVTLVNLSTMAHMEEIESGVYLKVVYAEIETQYGKTYTNVMLPIDRNHYNALIKHYQKLKNWNRYFYLKNSFPDLRQRDASTIHKSQGSTYDSVLIDLGNLSTCHNPNQVARMLYVAVSRAKDRVVFFGKLATKYGELIQ